MQAQKSSAMVTRLGLGALGVLTWLFSGVSAQTLTNVALNKPVQADSVYSVEIACGPDPCSPERAFDGVANDTQSRWISTLDEPTHYLAVDFETVQVVKSIDIRFVTWDKPGTYSLSEQYMYGVCRHAVSVWTGDYSVGLTSALESAHGWETVVRVDDFATYKQHESETFDMDVFATRYIKFDFDNSRCPAAIKREKLTYWPIVRVAEITVMGYAQATSTTITTNTQTTTTTTNTNLAALHTRIDDLLLEQVDGGNVNQKVQAIEELLQGIQTRQVVDANTITDMKATIGSLEQGKAQMGEELAALKAALSETTARLDGFLTTPNRPGTVSGGCDAGGSCTPPAITAGVDPATGLNPAGLKLSAPDGSVVVESSGCAPIDLCDLSRDVQSVLDKFAP